MNAQAKQTGQTDDMDDIDEDEDEDGIDIEVVDDVPEKDKPRRPESAPADIPEDDDLEAHTENVQKRIKKLTFEAKEALRHREEIARQRDEAVAHAQRILEENKRLHGQLTQGQASIVEQAKGRVDAEIASARKAYKEAYDLGDADKLMEANEKLIELNARSSQLKNYRAPAPQAEPAPPQRVQQPERTQQPPARPQLSEAQQDWMQKNDWWNKDRQMTAFALGVHEDLVESGVVPDSKTYYKEIDAAVAERFPDRLPKAQAAPRKPSTVVAGAARNTGTNRKSIRLTTSQVELARRLGITKEAYAAQVLKEQTDD